MQKSSIDITISKQIHFINFNQDSSCFCFGTDEGYELYNCNPLKCIKKKKIGKYGICYITMLYKTNILIYLLHYIFFKNLDVIRITSLQLEQASRQRTNKLLFLFSCDEFRELSLIDG